MIRKTKYILITDGFVIIFLLIKNFDDIKRGFERTKLDTTGFTGKTENGLKQGEWKNYYKNRNLAEIENYLNDTLNGTRIKYTSNGEYNLIEKYKMGIKVDTFKMYSQGKLNLIEYRDSLGMKHGEFRVYVNDSMSQIGNYLNNKFHGDFISYYYKTGKIKQIYQYEFGEKIGNWIYLNENGDTLKIEKFE